MNKVNIPAAARNVMMEIFINECDWKTPDRTIRLAEIIGKLRNYGWEKFGNSGAVVLFKDTAEEKAVAEMEELNISEVRPEVWEDDYIDLC